MKSIQKIKLAVIAIVVFASCNENEVTPDNSSDVMGLQQSKQVVAYPLPLPEVKVDKIGKQEKQAGSWINISGCGRDIAIGSTGDIAMVGCNRKIYRYINNTWQVDHPSQNVNSLTVDPWGRIYITNSSNEIWVDTDPNSNTTPWQRIAGHAIDIEASANGDLYCAGTNNKVFKYNYYNNTWTEVPGSSSVVRISADYYGTPVISNTQGRVWKYDAGTSWQHLAGIASDIAVNRANLHATGSNGKVYWYDFFANNWVEIGGAQNAIKIAVNIDDNPWVIVAGGAIFKRQ